MHSVIVSEPLGVHLLDDAALDALLREVVDVHVADHLLKLIRREHVTQDIEYLACAVGVQVVFDLLDAVEELLYHPAFSRVGCHEVEDEAVLLLAVAMDTAHSLLQTDGVPGDVVVDHQPAELEVDALAGCLGGHHHLGAVSVTEDPLGMEARAWGIAVTDLHAAVDLGDAQAPLGEPIYQVVKGVLVLGEDQELGRGVLEHTLIGDHVAKLHELGLDLSLFQDACLVDQPGQLQDLFSQGGRIYGCHNLFELGDRISCCSSSGSSS